MSSIAWLRSSPREGGSTITVDQLLIDLKASKTDLARVIEAVVRDRPPYILLPAQAVRAWERRAPNDWAKVAGWLASRNVAVVQV